MHPVRNFSEGDPDAEPGAAAGPAGVPAALYRVLRSSALAVALLLALAVLAAVGTLAPVPGEGEAPGPGSPLARFVGLEQTFRSPLFLGLVALVAVNVVACTWHRFSLRRRQRAARLRTLTDLLIHAALLLILAGGLVKGVFSFTGTQNIYVGESTATVYDWGERRDTPLGFDIRIDEFHEGFYPLRAQLGLHRVATGERLGLIEVLEGVPAASPGREVGLRVAGYDSAAGVIRFTVAVDGAERRVDLATKAGEAASARVGGYELTLVAYRADLKEARAHVSLIERGVAVAAGWLSPNTSLRHRGLSLFLTAWGADPQGKRVCGVQVVRDPGAAAFWAGCVLLALAIPGHFLAKGRPRA